MADVVTKDIASITTITQNCVDCGEKFELTKTMYKDGTDKLSVMHGRCERCQSVHLTNVRMDKFIASCTHLGNMTNRLSEQEKEVLISICTKVFESKCIARLRKTKEAKQTTGFNLKEYIA